MYMNSCLGLALLSVIAICGAATAQDEIELDVMPQDGSRLVLLDDLRAMQGSSVSVSTSVQDGVRVTKGTSSEDGNFEIRVDEETGEISVTMTREYGVDDADELMESHPELYMYLKAIPSEVGDSKIKVKIEVTTTITADDAESLKKKDEGAFVIYERYGKDSGMNVFRGRFDVRPGLRLDVPRIEMLPMEGARRPGVRDETDEEPSITLRVDEDGDAKVVENNKDKSKANKDQEDDNDRNNDKDKDDKDKDDKDDDNWR